jgi:hypothetical protein
MCERKAQWQAYWASNKQNPFDETEAHFVEAAFYEDFAPAGEASTSRIIGTPLPVWEDIRDHPEANLRNIL